MDSWNPAWLTSGCSICFVYNTTTGRCWIVLSAARLECSIIRIRGKAVERGDIWRAKGILKRPCNSSREENSGEVLDEHEVPAQPEEARQLSQALPVELGELLGNNRGELIAAMAIYQKILRDHPSDSGYLEQIGLLIENWQLAGVSPKAQGRFEIYGQIDEIWFIAVVRSDEVHGWSSLVTMHRMYARKVESRMRKGYLKKRED